MFKRLRQISQRVTDQLANLSTWPNAVRGKTADVGQGEQRGDPGSGRRGGNQGDSTDRGSRARSKSRRGSHLGSDLAGSAQATPQVKPARAGRKVSQAEIQAELQAELELRSGDPQLRSDQVGTKLESQVERVGKNRVTNIRASTGQGVKTLSAKKSTKQASKKDVAKAIPAKVAAKASAKKAGRTSGAGKATSAKKAAPNSKAGIAPKAKPVALAKDEVSKSKVATKPAVSKSKPAMQKATVKPIQKTPQKPLEKTVVSKPSGATSTPVVSAPVRGKSPAEKAGKAHIEESEVMVVSAPVDSTEAPVSEAAPVKLRQDPDPDRVAEKKKKKDDFKIDRNGDMVAQWESLREKTKLIKPLNYKMSESFEARIPIMHKVLGWGFVISNQNDRLEVLFKDGIRNLISNYKG